MTETEHLLTCLMEECAEVIQACSKALRFGLDDSHQANNPEIVSPRKYISRELADLTAVVELLSDKDALPSLSEAHIAAKKKKLAEFMEYSREKGTLS